MRRFRPRRPSLVLAGFLGAALLLLAASACGSDDVNGTAAVTTAPDGSGAGQLEGTWTLESASVDGDEVTAQTPAATITFADDGTFHGTTPCNGLGGTWTDDDGTLVLELGMMTQMACAEPEVQAQETAITKGFPSVSSAQLDGDALVLSGDGVTFRWVSGPEGIAGSYDVTGVSNGNGAVVSSALTEALSIEFADDGTVSGNDGCNSFASTYTVDGSSLQIGPDMTGTLIGCPQDVSELAHQFTTALVEVASWERNGQVVTLRGAAGATIVTLVPAS